MREDYRKAFDKLAPKRSDDELLRTVLGKADNMEKKKLNKKAIIVPVAAALALTLGAVGVTAALNTEHLREVFGGNESITENIHNYVFEDSDEHIKMTVDEYLSDGQCTFLTVHYQALDEEGEKWLAEKEFIFNWPINIQLGVYPEINRSDGIDYNKNYGLSMREIEEFTTETDRYFEVYFACCSPCYGTANACFHYQLTNGITRKTTLDISNNVEAKWFELNAEKSPSEFYIPKYLVLSDLSFSIMGENTGAYERTKSYIKSLMTTEQEETDAIRNIRFALSDGSEYKLLYYWFLSSSDASEENRYTDIDIAGGVFFNYDDFEIEVDVDNIVGLYIGDVYYELSEE